MGYDLGWRKHLYDRAPYAVKNAFASAYGAQQRFHRYGPHYRDVLQRLQREEYISSATLHERRLELVRDFLLDAQANSPYYGALFAEYGFSPRKMTSLADLAKLPVLSKETVRNEGARITSRRLRALDVRWMHTSGTTGKSLRFPMSAYGFQREYAYRANHYRWAGVSLDARDRLAFAFGHPVAAADRTEPPFWTYDRVNNWLLMSSYHLSERNLPSYVAELERFQPLMLAGYPSSVYLLAKAVERWGKGRLNVRAVFTASETLLDHQRAAIERGLGCEVFMWYGNTEMCANIVECKYGSLHGRIDHSHMEVVDAEGQPAIEGRLVCTGFGNRAFHLVRYDIGDVVRRSERSECKCGRPGEFFMRVVGRMDDYVLTPDGRSVGRLDHIFKDAQNVREAQIIQRDLAEITIRVVRREPYDVGDERRLAAETRLRLGSEMRIRFEYVDALERTSAGKLRFIVSHLHTGTITS
jgi:phenylacetate-CoA ligase